MKRRFQAGFQIGEGTSEIAGANIQRTDYATDRADRLQQPVKGAEETEKDQHADQIAGGFARFVEA
jgi:hypothetical protein